MWQNLPWRFVSRINLSPFWSLVTSRKRFWETHCQIYRNTIRKIGKTHNTIAKRYIRVSGVCMHAHVYSGCQYCFLSATIFPGDSFSVCRKKKPARRAGITDNRTVSVEINDVTHFPGGYTNHPGQYRRYRNQCLRTVQCSLCWFKIKLLQSLTKKNTTADNISGV